MVASFDKSSPVVDYRPNCLPHEKVSKKTQRWILWPAYAYKVIVPRQKKNNINIFQKYVLLLCRAGVTSPIEIGDKLDIGKDLAAYIIQQLRGRGFIDDNSLPLQSGLKAIEGDDSDNMETVCGYIYKDPFSGNLWPRFTLGNLNYVQSNTSGITKQVILGDVGRPYHIAAKVIWPNSCCSVENNPIDPITILKAIKTHAKNRKHFVRMAEKMPSDEVELLNISSADLPRYVERVSIVDETPEPVFLTTFIFIPTDITQGSLWQVCDPFGLGISSRLRRDIDNLINKDGESILKQEIELLTQSAYSIDPLDKAALIDIQNKEASEIIYKRLGEAIRGYPDIFNKLIHMEKARLSMPESGDNAVTGWEIRQKELKSFLRSAYSILEEVFRLTLDEYPADYNELPLTENQEDNANFLSDIASKKVGFVDHEDNPCFDEFFSVPRGQLKSVIMYDDYELRALVAACMFVAVNQHEHPLYNAALVFSDLINFLFRVKSLRDSSAHASRCILPATDLKEISDDLYKTIRSFLPEIITKSDNKQAGTGVYSNSFGLDFKHRLRAQAVQKIETDIGPEIREIPELKRHLLDMQQILIEIDHNSEPDTYLSIDTDNLKKDFMITAAVSMEEMFHCMQEFYPEKNYDHLLSFDRKENAKQYLQIAKDIGFKCLENNTLPQDLVMVKKEKVVRALRTNKGTLNSLALASLLTARHENTHSLYRFVSLYPEFLLDISKISKIRGHGHSSILCNVDISAIENIVKTSAKILLNNIV